jgi:SAM-dependent methyltransferase
MDKRIDAAAKVIESGDGQPFLRFMADTYHGHRNGSDPKILALAAEIGLIRNAGDKIELTNPGFLVGNVAKEYCHYVDYGRTTAPPKPSREMIEGKDVLDLGCSFGRSLWEFQRVARSAVGLEPQEEYIVLGRALSVQENVAAPKIINGPAEELARHFGPASLDVIFTRLVLNYVKVKPVLGQMVAALRPGGTLYILVDSPSNLPRRLLAGGSSLQRRGWILLALLNLPVCVLTGRQLSVTIPGRMHTRHNPAYLPLWWWRKALLRRGLRDFRTFPGSGALVFCATKPASTENAR